MKKHELKSVILHITDACTSHCPYCYACAGVNNSQFADSEKLYQIIDILSSYGIERISLLGGDPVLHPNIMDIAKKAFYSGIHVGIMSNTMNFPVSFQEVTHYIDTFETTIHGKNSDEHDSFSMAEGSYKNLTKHLRELSEFDVTIGIAINIIPQNVDAIYDAIKNLLLIEKIKISYVILQRIVPFGRAAKKPEFLLDKELVNIAMENVDRIAKDLGINILVEDPFPLCAMDEKYRKYMSPCEWGFTKAALNGEGDITRCGADPRYLLGNIFQTPLKEIWEESPMLKRFREREYLPNSCKTCQLVNRCGGGCALGTSQHADLGCDYLINNSFNGT